VFDVFTLLRCYATWLVVSCGLLGANCQLHLQNSSSPKRMLVTFRYAVVLGQVLTVGTNRWFLHEALKTGISVNGVQQSVKTQWEFGFATSCWYYLMLQV
jgi:hypothetical protein